MATLSAAACPAQSRPHPTPAALATTRVIDAIGDIECRLLALEAIEQLVSPQKAGSNEDLTHVDRASFGWLLTIVNVDLRQQLEVARAHADALSLSLYHQSQDVCGSRCHDGNGSTLEAGIPSSGCAYDTRN